MMKFMAKAGPLRPAKLGITIVVISVAGLAAMGALAQTGSRIGGGAHPQNTMWLGEPGEFAEIRTLIDNSKAGEAVEVARGFIARERGSPSADGQMHEYYGLNALCVALTANGDGAESIAVCNDAIAKSPSRWHAFNSRGTAHYVQDHFGAALEDYRQALELAPNSKSIDSLIRHNIELAEANL